MTMPVATRCFAASSSRSVMAVVGVALLVGSLCGTEAWQQQSTSSSFSSFPSNNRNRFNSNNYNNNNGFQTPSKWDNLNNNNNNNNNNGGYNNGQQQQQPGSFGSVNNNNNNNGNRMSSFGNNNNNINYNNGNSYQPAQPRQGFSNNNPSYQQQQQQQPPARSSYNSQSYNNNQQQQSYQMQQPAYNNEYDNYYDNNNDDYYSDQGDYYGNMVETTRGARPNPLGRLLASLKKAVTVPSPKQTQKQKVKQVVNQALQILRRDPSNFATTDGRRMELARKNPIFYQQIDDPSEEESLEYDDLTFSFRESNTNNYKMEVGVHLRNLEGCYMWIVAENGVLQQLLLIDTEDSNNQLEITIPWNQQETYDYNYNYSDQENYDYAYSNNNNNNNNQASYSRQWWSTRTGRQDPIERVSKTKKECVRWPKTSNGVGGEACVEDAGHGLQSQRVRTAGQPVTVFGSLYRKHAQTITILNDTYCKKNHVSHYCTLVCRTY